MAGIGGGAVCYYLLASLYAAVTLWCGYKLAQLRSASSYWGTQNSMHALIGVASGIRAVFFVFIEHEKESAEYFFVQVTGEGADTWLYVFDEAPSLLLLVTIGLFVNLWAYSYHTVRHSLEWYTSRLRPGAIAALAVLVAGQVAIWVCYARLRNDRVSDDLSIAEGSAFAVAYVSAACAIVYYGCSTASQTSTVAATNMAVRNKNEQRLRTQAAACGIAFALRAVASLVAAVAAADQLDDRMTTISETSAAVGSLVLFLLLELLPIATLLRANSRVTGVGVVPSPSALCRGVIATTRELL